jgi:type IV pilus assembly protein PilC
MPLFQYKAKDFQGEYHKGEIETADAREAVRLLQRKRLIVISVHSSGNTIADKYLGKILNRVAFADVVVTTRQLATMIEAGLVLSDAVDILADQQEGKRFKAVLTEVSSDIKGGLDFGSALEKHPDVFPKLYINLVRAGEVSGKLDTILQELANSLEREREFRSRVRGAMIYPIIVVSLMFAVMGVMVFFVIPRLTSLYSQSSTELPLPTRILIGTSNFALSYWWIMLLGIIAFVVMFHRFLSNPKGRLLFDTYMLKFPIIGRIIRLVVLTNFTRTFALLVGAGIPILETIKITSNVVGNKAYESALEVSYKGVERGLTLSAQILSFPIFPKIVGQMIRTGEETGKLDQVLSKMSSYFESEADNTFKNITTLIEPLVLIVLGLGVGMLVLSIVLPIYKLTTAVQ